MENEVITPKRLIPYAGSKYRYLTSLDYRFPPALKEKKIELYLEPFLGSGSVLYFILANYPPKIAIVNDSNRQIINIHKQALANPVGVIKYLNRIRTDMLELGRAKNKQIEYIKDISLKPQTKNATYLNSAEEAADTHFLIKQVFSSMLKQNQNGEFNATIHKDKLPNWEERLDMSIDGVNDIHELVNNYTKYSNLIEFNNTNWDNFLQQTLKKYSGISPSKVFIYIDPPYVGVDETGEIYMYDLYKTADSRFDVDDFNNLINQVKFYSKEGYNIMFSHTDMPYLTSLFRFTKFKPATFSVLYSLTQTNKEECIWTNYNYY